MPIDSTAELLFRVGADSSDAEGNIQRFRQILSKDLSGIAGEFQNWSKNVFGSLNTVQGGLTAIAAVIAAAAVGLAAGLSSAAEKAAKYAEEIEDGMNKTGLAAEEMSKLRYSAQTASLQYEELVGSLVKFETSIVKAKDGTSEQADWFRRLGVSQKDVAAGSKELLPLLLKTADGFAQQASTVEKAAAARALFSRSGADLLEFLSRGSAGIQDFMQRAEKLGLVIMDKDVIAAKALKLEMMELNAQTEALGLTVGKAWLPWQTLWATMKVAALTAAKESFTEWNGLAKFIISFPREMAKAYEDLQAKLQAALGSKGTKSLLPPETKKDAQETAQSFDQLSAFLDQVQRRMGSLGNEEERVRAEAGHLNFELERHREKLLELAAQGKITGQTFIEQLVAYAQAGAAIGELAVAQVKEIERKRAEAVITATHDLVGRIAGMAEETFEIRRQAFEREIEALRRKMAIEGTLIGENWDLLAELERKGLAKIAREQTAAYIGILRSLQDNLAAITSSRFTAQERLAFTYQTDLEKFSEIEEAKALEVAKTEGEADAIREQYAMNRRAALVRYQGELATLRNSIGWRGVFGNEFAQAIKGNEALSREWAETTSQSMMLVRVAVEALNEDAQRAFGNFAKGMGANIAQAIVYRKSIGEAMRAATAAALESLGAEALVQAIYATAIGFLRLAQHDFPAASAAFQAAAIFGTVGVAAAVAGRAIAPRQDSATKAGAQGGASTGQSGGSSAPEAPKRATNVNIYVSGHIIGQSGVEELTNMINEAVKDRDVRLVATQVREGARLIR